MIHPLRRWHVRIWLLLALVVPLLFAWALRHRAPVSAHSPDAAATREPSP
jgi:hypothetical protein